MTTDITTASTVHEPLMNVGGANHGLMVERVDGNVLVLNINITTNGGDGIEAILRQIALVFRRERIG